MLSIIMISGYLVDCLAVSQVKLIYMTTGANLLPTNKGTKT